MGGALHFTAASGHQCYGWPALPHAKPVACPCPPIPSRLQPPAAYALRSSPPPSSSASHQGSSLHWHKGRGGVHGSGMAISEWRGGVGLANTTRCTNHTLHCNAGVNARTSLPGLHTNGTLPHASCGQAGAKPYLRTLLLFQHVARWPTEPPSPPPPCPLAALSPAALAADHHQHKVPPT